MIAKASKDSKKNIEIIANIWGWSKFMGWTDKNTLHGISLLDKSISVLAVSEYDLKIKHAKKSLSLVDYSISNIGPSEVTKKMLSYARKLGHKVYAKIQVNNSWECSAVPFYPNYFSLAQHVKNLSAIGVNDFFCSWTLGGYPSLNFVLVNELIKNPKLNINNFLEKNFGKKLSLGIKEFDSALKYYPFSVDNLYFGPKTLGLTNLWKIHESEESSMVCFSRNDYEKWIHPFPGAVEFLHNKERYCLWLQGANPAELRQCPTVYERVEQVRAMRAASSAASTRKMAETPTIFAQITQPLGVPFLLVPRVSSERRRYIPMGFFDGYVISSDAVQIIPSATLYHFGVLTSNVHMSWMRAVCGRLKSDYRYSKDIVYNNFPWPTPTDEQKAKIEQTAQAILDARALYPDCSLADLYDEVAMPVELRKAHQENDRAVMAAYGFKVGMTESECVARLLEMYQELTR